MDVNEQISQVIQKRLGGDYSLETRVDFSQYDTDRKAEAGFVFIVKNPLIESDPEQAKKQILEALGKIEPLKAHIVTETEINHMERLAKELEYFRTQEFVANDNGDGKPYVTIHDKAPEWFRELPKRSGWNIEHALNVTKADTGIITINIDTPKDATVEDIAKNIENRKAAIMEVLADRVVKYTPTAKTPEEKAALKEKVKKLEFSVMPESNGDSKSIKIMIMSAEQLAATKLPGGITADKVQALNATNPLLALQNGENDHEPGKPQPHLQKALARAVLFSGPPEQYAAILPYIMGKEDMRRMVGKSLTNLKAKMGSNAELVKRIDAFLGDEVFKDHRTWGKPIEKQEDIPQAPRFHKLTGDFNDPSKPYEPGVMRVTVELPADKFKDIRDKIAALDGPAAGQAASSDAVAQAIDARMKPLVEAMVTTIQNQQQIANHIVAQETQTASSQSAMEKAAGALLAVATKLSNWVDRMESRRKVPAVTVNPVAANIAVSQSDETMANTVLSAAGITTTQGSTIASSIAASGPTSLLTRAEQPASEPQFTMGA